MNNSDEFFTPEDVDWQIERVHQSKEGEPADTQTLAFLRSYYHQDAAKEQEALDRMWDQITHAKASSQEHTKGKVIPMRDSRLVYNKAIPRQSRHIWQRLGTIAAVLFIVALVGGMAIVFNAARHNNTTTGSGGNHGGGVVQHSTPQPTSAPVYPTG